MKHLFLKDLVSSIKRDDCIASYEAISDALHYLDKEGEIDLEELKIKYIRRSLTQNEINFMNWHLQNCQECLDDVKFKTILHKGFEASDKYGDEVIAKVESNELLEKSAAYFKENRPREAFMFIQKALELKPGDEEIGKRILEIMPLELFNDNVKLPLEVESGGIFSIIEEPAIVFNVRVDWAGQEECSHSFLDSTALGERSGSGEGEKIEPVTFGSNRITVQVEKMGDATKIVIKFK